jgi:hypothetical protein
MKVYVILYTDGGYDGEIDRLWQDDDGNYLVFAKKQDAESYIVKTTKRKLNKSEFEIKEVTVQ